MTLQPTSVPENSTSDCLDEYTELNRHAIIVYLVVISVLGIVGNMFVLLVFCLHKKPCTVPEIYLCNLAAADLLLVSALPFWAANVAKNYEWPFGAALCRLVSMDIEMSACCSIYFLVLVSKDRYVAVVHPISLGRMRTPKCAKLGCLVVWGFGLLMSVPTIMYRTLEEDPDYKQVFCFMEYPNTTVELICNGMWIILSFIIPLFIISFCTVKIVLALKKQANTRSHGKNKATLLVLVVFVAFLICWVPHHLGSILEMLQRAKILGGCDFRNNLNISRQIFVYLAFFNSALNPVLYVIVGQNFREKVCELFKMGKLRADLQGQQSSAPSFQAVELDTNTEN